MLHGSLRGVLGHVGGRQRTNAIKFGAEKSIEDRRRHAQTELPRGRRSRWPESNSHAPPPLGVTVRRDVSAYATKTRIQL